MRYKTVMDLHTHTIASGHAYNTRREMAKAAADRGLEILGITEHAPMMPGTCHNYYFHNLKPVPRELYGIRLFLGAELNILNPQGEVDLNEAELRGMDIGIASLHLPCMKPGTREENTSAYLNAMKHPCVKVVGHCDNPQFPVDYETLAVAAKEFGVIFEINEASLAHYGYRGDTRANNGEILKYCTKYEIPIVLSSDSHGTGHIGDFTYAAEFVHEEMFPEELILNNNIPRLKMILSER